MFRLRDHRISDKRLVGIVHIFIFREPSPNSEQHSSDLFDVRPLKQPAVIFFHTRMENKQFVGRFNLA
jgi:hypothetical protein